MDGAWQTSYMQPQQPHGKLGTGSYAGWRIPGYV